MTEEEKHNFQMWKKMEKEMEKESKEREDFLYEIV